MPIEYLRDGDTGFIGLNSRDNPASLPKGFVSQSQNFRLDRGVATVRKGLKRKTSTAILNTKIYGICTVLDLTGQEVFVVAVTDGLYTYNPQTEIFTNKVSFPAGETIVDADVAPPYSNGVSDMVLAIDKIYISRGTAKRPLVATIDLTTYVVTSVEVLDQSTGDGHEFPNASGLMYYGNRLVAIGQDHRLGYTPTARARDSVSVSNYLDFNHWDALDVFNINEGSNDEVITIAPWSLLEFVVFMRNCIYYVNVGSGRYTYSDPLSSSASMRLLVSDVGCNAKRSVVQANGGIIFLSDNGVYFLSPTQVGANDATRLLTNASPLSAPIDDIIQRINKKYAYRAVATYWNNRYYLAVPLDDSQDNNTVLVYNFILNAWESVDTYPYYTVASATYQVSRGSPYVTIWAANNNLVDGQYVNISSVSGGQIPSTKYQASSPTSSSLIITSSTSPTIPITTATYTVTGTGYPYTINVTTPTDHGLTNTTSLADYPVSGSGYIPLPTLEVLTSPTKFTNTRYGISITGATTFTFQVTSGLVAGTTSGTLTYNQAYGKLKFSYGFDVLNFVIGKKDSQRRLFAFDADEGIFMFDELDYDEYGSGTGTPVLPFILPATLSTSAYTRYNINGILKTRRFTFNSLREKRFSTLETEINSGAGSSLQTYSDVQNQDTYTLTDSFGAASIEDSTRRSAIRKIGTGIQLKYITTNLITSIYSCIVNATLLGKTNKNSK